MTWDVTTKRLVREAHENGVWDLLRAILDEFDREPDHFCIARSFVERLYRDPRLFSDWVKNAQEAREK